MEKPVSAGGMVWFLCGFLVTSLLLCAINADGVSDPTGNVNLSPFQQILSVYECMQNTSASCPDTFKLTEKGWLNNITRADTEDYCKPGGCVEHTTAVLMCIHLVKRNYKFANKATVQDLNHTITHGCSFGFNGTVLITSNARKMYESKTALFISILPALLLMSHFNM